MTADPPSAPETLARLVARVGSELQARMAAPLEPGLYLVATPIGHLADITLRALVVLASADEVYCEDTRQSGKLLARYGLDRRLARYHEHNAASERPRIEAAVAAGRSVALISDAGMPLISDPGYKLARQLIAAGHRVIAIPGASATLTALAVSGLPTDSFHFAGFAPHRSAARRARFAELASIPGSLILFEAPSRLAESLADLTDVLGDRPAVVARELTKLHEEVERGPLSQLAAWAERRPVKGEIVIVVGPPVATEIDDAAIVAALAACPEGTSVRDRATAVASGLGVSKSRVYDIAVGLKRDQVDDNE